MDITVEQVAVWFGGVIVASICWGVIYFITHRTLKTKSASSEATNAILSEKLAVAIQKIKVLHASHVLHTEGTVQDNIVAIFEGFEKGYKPVNQVWSFLDSLACLWGDQECISAVMHNFRTAQAKFNEEFETDLQASLKHSDLSLGKGFFRFDARGMRSITKFIGY